MVSTLPAGAQADPGTTEAVGPSAKAPRGRTCVACVAVVIGVAAVPPRRTFRERDQTISVAGATPIV
jgi:hypothetical protein